MSARELGRWMRFEATVQPLPDRLADLHNAMICSTMVNLVRSVDSPPMSAIDFLILIDRDPPPPARKANGAAPPTEADRMRLLWESR